MGNKQKGKRAKKEEPVRKVFGMDLPAIDTGRRNTLIFTSLITKAIVAIMTTYVFGSFIDFFGDHNSYIVIQDVLLHGASPWVNPGLFYYPPLALVPPIIAYLASLVGGFAGFIVMMWMIMAVCDIGTTLCVYYVGLKMYSERMAFVAAMLTATAFSSAYFALSDFDAIPVFLAMLALLATVYNNKVGGYLAAIAGMFTKFWPILLYPFLWIYNARESSIIQEGKKRAIPLLLATAAIFGLVILAGYTQFMFFVGVVYCNSIPYLVSYVLPWVSFDISYQTFRGILVIATLGALYWAYRKPGSLLRMVKMILLVTVMLVFFIQYRSPQYEVWMVPFAALLVAGDQVGIMMFYWIQGLAYIEFPLTYYTLWINDHYVSPLAPVFFAILFASYGVLLWRALRIPEGVNGDE